MSEDTFSRLFEAGKDALAPFRGARAVITKGIAGLLSLGYLTAASLKPEVFLPPTVLGKVALLIFALLTPVWPVVVAYRLRADIRKLNERHSALTEPERVLILQLRRVAGRALHRYEDMPFGGSVTDKKDIQELHNLCGELRHHKGIYERGINLGWSLSVIAASEMTGKEFLEVISPVKSMYESLLLECDRVLKPSIDPVQSKASGSAQPSSRASSE
jgi:hypothetical protein